MTDLYYWITRNDHKIRMFLEKAGYDLPSRAVNCATTYGSRVVDVTAAISDARSRPRLFGQTASAVR